jgi:hypothetical protein
MNGTMLHTSILASESNTSSHIMLLDHDLLIYNFYVKASVILHTECNEESAFVSAFARQSTEWIALSRLLFLLRRLVDQGSKGPCRGSQETKRQ